MCKNTFITTGLVKKNYKKPKPGKTFLKNKQTQKSNVKDAI
jgi:hypothetical protein